MVHQKSGLTVENLRVSVLSDGGIHELIRGVNLELPANQTLGVLGPSGAGKTVTALSILGLPPGGRNSIREGSIRLDGTELTELRESGYRRVRGAEIAMVFQDPGTSLTPVHRIGKQLADTLSAHFPLGRKEARDRALALLCEVGFPDPERTGRAYVHELSGGMQQRAMIALALAGEPSVLIADEPTSALDAIATDQILSLLEATQRRRSIAILLISHDPDVMTRMADRIALLEAGRIREVISPEELAARRAAATASKSAPEPTASPSAGRATAAGGSQPAPDVSMPSPAASRPVLEVRHLSAGYPSGEGRRPPVDRPVIENLSLKLMPGEILGLVGESGCGKTTLARCILRMMEPIEGQILLDGIDISSLSQRQLRPFRRQIGSVFQNPGSSLNPRRTVSQILEAPLLAHGAATRPTRRERVTEALEAVDLDRGYLDRKPHQLSGGQQQRVALARALVNRPPVLICDEPFTALDLPLQAQLAALLLGLQRHRNLACLFIAHDLEVVREIADRVAVMQAGRIIETGPTDSVLTNPRHKFTQALVAAGPRHADNSYI